MTENDKMKTVVSVTEMARMCGLSRSRFYQLIGSAFPKPCYDKKTKRPYYDEEQQEICLEVRRKNCGIDGKPILFYSRRSQVTTATPRRKKTNQQPKPKSTDQHAKLTESLKGLGLETTTNQVRAAMKELYSNGTATIDEAEIIRTVFLQIQRKNTADNVE